MEMKEQVIRLKEEGLGNTEIAKQIGISVNTVQSIVRRSFGKKGFCRNCGKQLTGNSKQEFCSRHCRYEWQKNNAELIPGPANYEQKCKYCGKSFQSYGNKKRKYCSHECYINDRFGVANSI